MRRQVAAVCRLVERTVETGDEEHQHLGTHTEEQPEVGTRHVGQLEQSTEDHD